MSLTRVPHGEFKDVSPKATYIETSEHRDPKRIAKRYNLSEFNALRTDK